MRPLLISLTCFISWIFYAESQTPVLTPSSLTVNREQTATFTCNVGVKDNYVTQFLRQTSGEAPQLILYHHHSYTEPKYGLGFSSSHFSSTKNSAGTEFQLIIKDSNTADTVLYYCVKWYANLGWVFSKSSKLIVTVDNYPTPALNVFQPPNESDSSSGKPFLTCHASKLTVGLVNVNWQIDGTSVQQGVSTSQPVREADNSFSVSSYMEINPDDMKKDKVISCWIQQEGSSIFTSQGIKLSQC